MADLIKALKNMDMAEIDAACKSAAEKQALDFNWEQVISEPVGVDLLVAVAPPGDPVYGLPGKDGLTILDAIAQRGSSSSLDLVYPMIGDPLPMVDQAIQYALASRSVNFIERIIKKVGLEELDAIDIENDQLIDIFKLGIKSNGNKTLCEFCMQMGVNFNVNSERRPMVAWMIQHPKALPYLFASDADLSVRLEDNNTLLHLMAGSPNFKSTSQANINSAIEKLLSAGIGVDDKNDSGRTALFYATDSGQANGKSFVMTLIDQDADLQAPASYDGNVTAEEYIIKAWGEAAYAAISRAKLNKQMLAEEQTLDDEIAAVSSMPRRGRGPARL